MFEVDGRTFTLADRDSVRLCLRGDKCTCPEGERADAVPVTGRFVTFAPPAREVNAFHKVRNEQWDPEVMCKQEEDPQTAQSNGDPHLVTFDGIVYDSMTLGEFVYARDPEGGFEIQGRHESASLPGAASTSAVAVSDGDHRITFTYHEFGPERAARDARRRCPDGRAHLRGRRSGGRHQPRRRDDRDMAGRQLDRARQHRRLVVLRRQRHA
jgi:hypothetical protein